MRKTAVALVAVLLVSGCTDAGSAPADAVGTRSPEAVVTQPPPVAAWRLATLPELAGPTSGLADVVSVDATHAWAVGSEAYDPERPNDTGTPLVLRGDGTRWVRAALPPIGWHGRFGLVAAGSPSDVWVVGTTAVASPEDQAAHVLHYDGSAWREVPFPQGNEGFVSITGLSVAGGRAWVVGSNRVGTVVEEWDGGSWRSHRLPRECRSGGTSFGGMPNFCNVSAVKAFGPDDVWAAGNGAWKGFKGPLLFHWNGSGWRTVNVGITNEELAFDALAGRSSGELWAVGQHGLAVRGGGGSFEVLRDAPDGLSPDVVTDPAGLPWLVENSVAPSASFAVYRAGTWIDVPAPQPPDAVGMSLNAITATPGSTLMFAVGAADLPTTPRHLRAVLLEYAPAPSPETSRL
ncbi:hypothetical protein AB0J82_33440 [Asanoa sp. NPDC049518]|uniref:hypothetical protein n=1 Tax=unclassified Asanoa TaxID=2685164 RepID=UPI003421DF5B